ncbi:uncharacterized protein At4g13200, chloroplastic-like [Salvia miltiorrhiza]|uniref:uncharacterized protein At4g13200, chloroplastic-like n=1 Tax=Salvia miltiorrhiza TaxID=226208 RepID=UPI0025AC0F95|nr:uncharacterized protein At4g13200, chloroplastic-like [Salvia miltiorrhiza]
MACSQSYTAFPASINRGRSVVVPPANPLFPNSNKFGSLKYSRINLRCNSIGDSGENGCKVMLDAFFLGKAIGEMLSERIESSVGEFLGVVGRLLSDPLKHVSEFQEEVLEKAKRAKEEATQVGVGLVSDATSTVKEATKEAEELISEAAEQATEEARGLVSDAASVAASVISEASSAAKDPFLGLFNED